MTRTRDSGGSESLTRTEAAHRVSDPAGVGRSWSRSSCRAASLSEVITPVSHRDSELADDSVQSRQ